MITKLDVQRVVEACVQDQPPACSAACPLHVDVRALLADAAAGRWESAAATLATAVPFPGVLSRICTQPCRPVCRRGEAGDPIRIAAVERACADLAGPGGTAAPPGRARAERVAVVGGGLAGVTAALDLARKRYQVTLYESADRLGASLAAVGDGVLPRDLVERELDAARRAGARVELGQAVEPDGLEELRARFEAVVVATGPQGSRLGLAVTADGALAIDPVTRMTSRDGVFAAGSVTAATGGASPVDRIAGGRRAATSVDRYLQGVSLTGSRGGEGPVTTCLFTRTDGVPAEAEVAAADPAAGYAAGEASAEAARCLQCACLECVKACAYLEHFGSHPALYARRVLHNMLMIKGNHTANRLINACSLCGLCAQVCPTGVDMGDLLRRVRQRMVATGSMPPSAHDFALRDLEFSNGPAFALARARPGAQECRYAFFPGCQLAGSAPQDVRAAYEYLVGVLGDVGLILRCCGATADWAGRSDLLEGALAAFDEQYRALGSPTLVVACSSCQQVFARHRPDVPLLSLWTVIDEHGLPPGAAGSGAGHPLAVHDPCTARHEGAVQDGVRRVLDRLGYRVEELEQSRELTECCSYGGLMWLADREVAEKTVRRRIGRSDHDYVTYCVMCRDLFAARGKRTVHLLDLVLGHDLDARARRPNPGWSQRHENRTRLKQEMLATVWGERPEEDGAAMGSQGDGDAVRLEVSPEVAAVLEDRLILLSDLRAAVAHAERTGERLRDRTSGHWLTRHRPREVTYWVEYSLLPGEDGTTALVHRAYSHRLQVIEGGRP